MDRFARYKNLAPFSADTLIVAVNELLTAHGIPAISKRTLRYYTTQGIVPRPIGSPRFARYSFDHFMMLVGSRALQQEGQTLEDNLETLKSYQSDAQKFAKTVSVSLDRARQNFVAFREPTSVYDASIEVREPQSSALKLHIDLGSGYTLIAPGDTTDLEARATAKELLT